MKKLQFRVLYREFLFRMVDLEVLSAHAQGDSNQLVGRFASLMIFLSLILGGAALAMLKPVPPIVYWALSASLEHFLIATTMLIVGLFAVLSWDSTFPTRQDVLVLTPLPLKPNTIFLAKVAAVGTALVVTIVSLHVLSGAIWPLALNQDVLPVAVPTFTADSALGRNLASALHSGKLDPDQAVHILSRLMGTPGIRIPHITMPAQTRSILSLLRLFVAYWTTMLAAGAYMFCCVLGVQGLATQLLPRRILLRVSAVLQLSIFCLLVTVYFVQPILATPDALIEAQGHGLLSWSPSYWFLGLFEQLIRTPAMAPLAHKAWIGLAVAVSGTAVAYALSYFRTLRKIVEEPDILPGARGISWLPPFGNPPQTAIVQFAIRTLLRSRQHRVILAFYLSVGFAMTIFLLRSPAVTERFLETTAADPLHEVSIPVLAATLVMLIFAVGGTRVLFSLPMDLRANWIFRTTARLDNRQYLAAARRSLLMLSFVPVWVISVIICFSLWPWRPALAHVIALGLLGSILADCLMFAFRKIPFTCSYLPGKSQVHMMILGAVCLLYCTLFAVKYEREVLGNEIACVGLLASLIAVAAWARWRSVSLSREESTWVRFEDAPTDEILVLGLAQPGQVDSGSLA